MADSFDFLALLKKHNIVELETQQRRHKPGPVFSVSNGLTKRKEILNHQRKSVRLSTFDSHRNLPLSEVSDQFNEKSKTVRRKMQFQKWKAEKEIKKEKEKANKKKPFLTGIVPTSLNYVPPPPVPSMKLKARSGPVTRSQSKVKEISNLNNKENETGKSFAPINAKFAPNIKFAADVPSLKQCKRTVNKKTNAMDSNIPTLHNEKRKEYCLRKSKKCISENKLKECDSNIMEPLPSKPLDSKKPPSSHIEYKESSSEDTHGSPFVTVAREKVNRRNTIKAKGMNDHPEEDTNFDNTSSNFRAKYESEVQRIIKMCEIWEDVSKTEALTESAQDVLLAATGQARLLVSQKLAQFRSLVDACERCEPGALRVTVQDLHGFWDMVYMQVEDVHLRFKKLEQLQARNWEEELQENVNEKKKSSKTKVSSLATVKSATTSRIREFILNAKKSKKENVIPVIPIEDKMNVKTFDAGFFQVQSPMKSLSSLATLRASIIETSVECESSSKN